MFERFTARARRVVVIAHEEARNLGHNYIGTEHLLLGLILHGDEVAAQALESLGISLEEVRYQVEVIVGHGQPTPIGHLPFTPGARKVLELSLREAQQLGHKYIGTEHILLGLIQEGEGVAAQVLKKLGADLNRTRQEVIKILGFLVGGPESAPPFILEIDEKIAQAVADKDAALDEGNVERAVHSRKEERRLLAERASREQEWKNATRQIDEKIDRVRREKMAAIDAQDFERARSLKEDEHRLVREKASLRRGKDLTQ
jgi:hypothetical protein